MKQQFHSWPGNSAAELNSLYSQTAKIDVDRNVISPELIRLAREKLDPLYPRCDAPSYTIPTDPSTLRDIFRRLTNTVNHKANPGFPFNLQWNTKGQVFEHAMEDFLDIVMARYYLILSKPTEEWLRMTPEQLVASGVTSPVQCILKGEVQPMEKIDRPRYIFMVCLADSLLDMFCCNAQNKLEISQWTTCPSQPGLSLADDGLREIHSLSYEKNLALRNLIGTDVSGWDHGVQGEILMADAERRITLYNYESDLHKEVLSKLIRVRMWCMSNSVYVTSTGRVYSQLIHGIMKSGSPNTSSTNSYSRCVLSVMAGSDPRAVRAMGDDCIEQETKHMVENYKTLGMPLKPYDRDPTKLEFCCHQFDITSPELKVVRLKMEKSLFGLLSSKHDSILYSQFVWEYRHHPMLNGFKRCYASCGRMEANGPQEDQTPTPSQACGEDATSAFNAGETDY